MASGEEGGGGKFRKKPLRKKQTTPYDRPTTNNNNNNGGGGGWLTRNVVDPASRLISYGAQRFFGSVFLAPSPPPETTQGEVYHEMNQELPGPPISNDQYEPQEPTDGECSRPTNISSGKGVIELEQMLKQKLFTRSEIDHLTALLQSRAVEEPDVSQRQNNEAAASDFGRRQRFANGLLDGTISEGIRSHGVMSTPIFNPKDDIASPAELAKAYMGSRPSKVSPSMLGTHIQVGMEDMGMLSNSALTSISPIMSLTRKPSVRLGTPENSFRTPRSRGRSAIYNMARTPYSRVGSASTLKGSGFNHNGYNGPSMASLSLPPVELDEKTESKSMILKRRISVLDDEVGSVGPIRRIRQKPNPLAPRFPHTSQRVAIGSAKQKYPLIGAPKQNIPKTVTENENESVPSTSHARVPSKSSEVAARILQHLDKLIGAPKQNIPKTVTENENESVPSTSHARVPSKSSEVAARILQHLDKLSPKEKSSESKLVALQSTPSMLSGRARRSMDGVNSSNLLLDVQNDHRLENRSNAALIDARDSTSQKLRKVEENGPKESVVHSDTWNPLKNNDSAVSLEASGPSTRFAEPFAREGGSQKKRAFRMSALEDDHVQSNGVALGPFSEHRGPTEVPVKESSLSPAEAPKSVTQPEVKSQLGLVFGQTSEFRPGSINFGQGSSGIPVHSPEEATAALQSAALPLSGTAFGKLNKANNPPPLFSFSSKVADKFPSLPSESHITPESYLENSSSLMKNSAPTGTQLKAPDIIGHLNPSKDADKIGNGPSAATNGPLFSRHPASSFNATSDGVSQMSTGSALLFSSSTSSANFVSTGTGTSTSANSIGSTFGSSVAPATSTMPIFKFGASIAPSTAVSAPSTTNISEAADLQTKAGIGLFTSSSSSTHPAIAADAAASSGSSLFGLASSAGHSTANNLQGSLFQSASKSSVFGVGTVQQGASSQSMSSASVPSFNINSTTFSGSTLSNSQVSESNIKFGFSTSASSSGTNANVPVSSSTSSVSIFGANSAVSQGSPSTFSSNASPGIFNFGLSASSSSTNAVGSSSVLANPSPVFSFGGSSLTQTAAKFGASSAISNSSTVTSSSNASPGIFSFGIGSSSSSANATGSGSGLASPPVFKFGGSSSVSASLTNTSSSFSSGTSGIFNFGGSSSAPSAAAYSVTLSSAPSNVFGTSWQTPQSSSFGSTFASPSPSPSTGFAFGASSTSSAPTNTAPTFFNPSTGASSNSMFSFSASSNSALSAPSPSLTQPIFGNLSSGFIASPGNNVQMNAEDSMAEDSPIFGHPPVSPSPSGYIFGQTVPSQTSPFQFNGQQNQVAPLSSTPFQASSSLEFNAGGSFSLGSGGGDKSGRKFVKVSKNRNRKK